MKTVVLITGHYWNSKRKAGFHWLADAFWREGWEVVFFTSAISCLSVLYGNYRLAYPVLQEANQLKQVKPNLWSYVWFTPWHPANLRSKFLNSISYPLFQFYGELPLGEVESKIRKANVFVFESTPGLLLFKRFKRLNSTAKFIYRVSDDLRLLKNHPVVLQTEADTAPIFDLVSVPSLAIHHIFAPLPNLKLELHGIRKDLFEQDYANPYLSFNSTDFSNQGVTSIQPNVVFVGNAYFDCDFLDRASQLFPNWRFHIIGPIPNLPVRPNIFAYGELPFEATVPYLKFADIGLHTLKYALGAECFSDSLKIMQYTYCKLPIIAPNYLSSPRNHIFYYQPGDSESIQQALQMAYKYERSIIQASTINSWDAFVCEWTKS